MKKTQNDPKKTRQRRSLEENEARRKRRFTPAESMHFQLGGHTNGRMMGSALVGYKGDLAALKQSHYKCVGQRYGLTMAESIPKFKRYEIARKVVDVLCSTKDLLDQPLIRTALQNIIQINPSELMSILGIPLSFDPPRNTKP